VEHIYSETWNNKEIRQYGMRQLATQSLTDAVIDDYYYSNMTSISQHSNNYTDNSYLVISSP